MDYENIAIRYAEIYGILNFIVKGNKMIYYEQFYDGTYKAVVNLDTLKESRSLLDTNKK